MFLAVTIGVFTILPAACLLGYWLGRRARARQDETEKSHAAGLRAKMRLLGMLVMPILLATVILLVFDIAHPRIGILRVRDPILTRLKQSF